MNTTSLTKKKQEMTVAEFNKEYGATIEGEPTEELSVALSKNKNKTMRLFGELFKSLEQLA